MLKGGLSIKFFARFKEDSVVGHDGVLMMLHHGLFHVNFMVLQELV